jgi:hypothetical protein
MTKVYLIDLEAVETRYTAQWKKYLPELLRGHGLDVQVIAGPEDIPQATTPGAFLNFGGTNVYKSSQVEQISRLFCSGSINSGDHFLFTDAWHPGIINLKYMSELLEIPVKIHALWHAGSYDPQDFLGRLIGNAPWVRHAEKSFFHAIDGNYFATKFHIQLFERNLLEMELTGGQWANGKIIRTGWPMEYMRDELSQYVGMEKRNLILFPHRIAPEKQVEIFRDMQRHMPEYEFVVCQDHQLSKHEYHTLLGQAKMVFSANLQETLGISCYEGAVVGAMPLVPDRLSYTEMYSDEFKYPSSWTIDWDHYVHHKKELHYRIYTMVKNFDRRTAAVKQLADTLNDNFFSADALIEQLRK